MKVLWIVNINFPCVAERLGVVPSVSGGWMISLASEITKHNDIELTIASMYDGPVIQRFEHEYIQYILVPGGQKAMLRYQAKSERYWREVIRTTNPDVIHIHGTEYAHGLACINACPNIPTVVSIQGLLHVCERNYYGGMEFKDILLFRSFRDNLLRDGIWEQKREFRRRAQYEHQVLRKVKHVIGRTKWDYANVRAINANLEYHSCNESMRDVFYQHQWNIHLIEKFSIFVSQGSYPLKGLHYLLEAMAIVIQKYPECKLYVGGYNITDTSSLRSRIRLSGYGKYLKYLIKKYDLQQHIIFTGPLDSTEMMVRLCKSNVFVLPSFIENSPNSLAEAMLLGVPSIASYVGGVPDVVGRDQSCLLYPPNEVAVLADHIMNVFVSDELAIRLSNNGQEIAHQKYGCENNYRKLFATYQSILLSQNTEQVVLTQ